MGRAGDRQRCRDRAARSGALAPSLWLAEVANALRKKSRRGEITEDEARLRAQDLCDAPVQPVELPILLPGAMRISGEIGHSVYDCFYLATAVLRDTTLVTDDRRFAAKVAASRHYAGYVDLLRDLTGTGS